MSRVEVLASALCIMKKSMLDAFNEDIEKTAVTWDSPIGNIPNPPSPSSFVPSQKTIDYEPKRGNSFLQVTPGAMIGSALGLAMGHSKGKKEMKAKMQKEVDRFNSAKPVIEGNYYQQAKHVMENLGVVFTPFGTVYTLRNKNKNVAIDTIETGEMNRTMKEAWKGKDSEYFRGLMMAKMHSEMQMAEQGFARQLLDSQSNERTAREKWDIFAMTDMEILAECLEFRGAVSAINDMEVIASVEEDFENGICNDFEDIRFNLELDRPFNKYAGVVSGIKSSLGFGTDSETFKETQKKLSSQSYLKNNVNVGFMPDRVIFTVDDKLISTLSLTNMNEEGYDRFNKSDKKYFKSLFCQEMKQSMRDKVAITECNHFEKVANLADEHSEEGIFSSPSIHPVVYYLSLTNHFGDKWFNYDPMALIKIIEDEFKLAEPICDSALDKILSIQVANIADSAYSSPHAFEKVVRAFNNKPIDFLEREDEDLDIDDIVFAIDVLDRVTPDDDIYDNFSPEVIDYIATILSKKETRCYAPTHIVGSALEPSFQEVMNEAILRVTNKLTTNSVIDAVLEDDVKKRNTYIHDMSLAVTKAVRRAITGKDADVVAIVNEMMVRSNVTEDLRVMVKSQVVKNLALDEVLKLKEIALVSQLKDCNIVSQGGGLDG